MGSVSVESGDESGPEPPPGAPPYRVKAVIRRDGWYLLAVHNNRVPENKGKWNFPGASSIRQTRRRGTR